MNVVVYLGYLNYKLFFPNVRFGKDKLSEGWLGLAITKSKVLDLNA